MPIPAPNYTQIPNVLFDLLPQMVEAELRLTMVIARQTFGWHKEQDKLSISQLQTLTGLSRQGVINGIEKGMERGTIVRQVDGNSFLYSLNLSPEPVNQVDSQPSVQAASQPSGLALVNEVDQPLVNEVDTQKKGVKEKERNVGSGCSSTPRTFENRPQAFTVYEQEIGTLTARVAELLDDDLNNYPEDWVIESIHLAAQHNKRSLAYAEGILKNWKANGRGAGKPQHRSNGYNGNGKVEIENTHKWDNTLVPGRVYEPTDLSTITF